MNMVDLDRPSSEDINLLRCVAREREMRKREERERAIATTADLLLKPTLGWYRRHWRGDPTP